MGRYTGRWLKPPTSLRKLNRPGHPRDVIVVDHQLARLDARQNCFLRVVAVGRSFTRVVRPWDDEIDLEVPVVLGVAGSYGEDVVVGQLAGVSAIGRTGDLAVGRKVSHQCRTADPCAGRRKTIYG